MNLEISKVAPEERPVLENLLQFYIHDFSEYWSGTDKGDLGDDGRFEAYPLDAYWSDARRAPLMFRLEGCPAGFALLNDHAHMGAPVDWNMAEFFVARKYRGAGVGRAAAHRIFSGHPGIWEVGVARRNTRALPFWRGAITAHPGLCDLSIHDLANSEWDGALFRFAIRAGRG